MECTVNSYSPKHPARQKLDGFTLIEVMVALTLIAVSMITLVGTSSQSITNAGDLKLQTLAQWVAENKAMEYQISKEFPNTGKKQGDVEMANQDWRWRVKVSNTDNRSIRRLDIDVILEDGEFDEPEASLVAFVSKPL